MHSPERIPKQKNKLLLHVCCGPCATTVIEKLQQAYALSLFFTNDNIFPETEFLRRQDSLLDLARQVSLPTITEQYAHNEWLMGIAGLEQEPERGKRCTQCFRYRLLRTARYAQKHNIVYFSTTLPISPYKDYQQIVSVGEEIAEDHDLQFIVEPFGVDGGYQRSIALSKQYNLYRQKYCGCEFSKT